MPNNKKYHDVRSFTNLLIDLRWEKVSPFGLFWDEQAPHTWERGNSRLYADEIGVFLFRLFDGVWVRTHGLSYDQVPRDNIFPRGRVIVFPDGSKLNLRTGEWHALKN